MAKKPASAPAPSSPARKPAAGPAKPAAAPVASTPVRNTPVPKPVARPIGATSNTGPRREITHADIAKRAYEIWASGKGGSETDNWLRAERELRAGL